MKFLFELFYVIKIQFKKYNNAYRVKKKDFNIKTKQISDEEYIIELFRNSASANNSSNSNTVC